MKHRQTPRTELGEEFLATPLRVQASPGQPAIETGITAIVDLSPSDVMTASEVAGLLRMNVKTVYDLAKTGEIPSWRLGRHFRFSRRVIVALLGQCKSASPQRGK